MTYRQSYTCPKCHMKYGPVKSVTLLDPMRDSGEPCLISWCQYTGKVYDFMPEARE